MWFGIAALIGLFVVLIECNGVPRGTKCYDCNYDPSLVPEITGDDFDWAAKPDRGYPRCSLHPTVDTSLVADTLCQGTCFIRKDINGLVYRGCADPWNLPYHVDTAVNCTRKDDGSVWWFCTGNHCNGGTFGDEGICPGDFSSYQNDAPSTMYIRENAQTNQIPRGNTLINVGDVYGHELSQDVKDKLDPYVIMESGWQAYQDELEPKSGEKDVSYAEPPASASPGTGRRQYSAPRTYTYQPPLQVEVYGLPALKNPVFVDHYKTLVPNPNRRVTNAFGPPEHLAASGTNVKSSPTEGKSHKSWRGDEYSVSYGKKSTGSASSEHVKSAYISPPHAKSSYTGQAAKSYRGTKSSSMIHSPSHAKSTDDQLYLLAYGPKKNHAMTNNRIHSKSGYSPAPVKSSSQVWMPEEQVSPKSHYRSEQTFASGDRYQPSQMYYGQMTYDQSMRSQQIESKSRESHVKSSESAANWLGSQSTTQQLYERWLASQKQSRQSNANWQSSQTSSKQFNVGSQVALQELQQSSENARKTQNNQQQSYESKLTWYNLPKKAPSAGNAYGLDTNTYGKSVPLQTVQLPSVESAKLNFNKVKLPDYKSSAFGDFWYENYYRGDKPDNSNYSNPPVTTYNPCNDDCSGNPSGLYPHPASGDWFIQCGAGVTESGSYCSCCRPNYLRCPEGTLFDVGTRVCSTIQESEYSYKPVF